MADLTFQVTKGGIAYDYEVVRVNKVDLVAQTMECVAKYPIPNAKNPDEYREEPLLMTKADAIAAGIAGSTFTNLIACIKQGFINKLGD